MNFRQISLYRFFVSLAVLVVAALVTAPVLAYESYSINDNTTNCRFCHGDYRRNSYISLSDGQNWGDLHDLHRETMLNGDCDACHEGGSRIPTPIGSSDGGDGLAPIGCVGCHGRAEDGTGDGTKGYGLAMQVRHNALVMGGDQNGDRCIDCHTDIGSRTPVPESVLPPYYANPGAFHPNMPTDSCNPAPGRTENFAGAVYGIDNDGDTTNPASPIVDELDPDCGGPAQTPGEVSGQGLAPLLVTSLDTTINQIGISFGVTCESTENIEYGALEDLPSYTYAGHACDIGSGPNGTWTYPDTPANLFFLVVGTDEVVEGSYGVDSLGAERPPDETSTVCPLPQDLTNRCD